MALAVRQSEKSLEAGLDRWNRIELLHDLRRTAATMCGELGLSEAAIATRSADKEDHAAARVYLRPCLDYVRSSLDNAHLVIAPGYRLRAKPGHHEAVRSSRE
jgi:hypothetical protein